LVDVQDLRRGLEYWGWHIKSSFKKTGLADKVEPRKNVARNPPSINQQKDYDRIWDIANFGLNTFCATGGSLGDLDSPNK